jgi:hypothetical protein
MMKRILEASDSDQRLSTILDEVRAYAQVYVLARQRQKGSDGFGEMTNLKEEFRDVIDKVIQYSQEKKYISEVISCDIDSIADEIERL